MDANLLNAWVMETVIPMSYWAVSSRNEVIAFVQVNGYKSNRGKGEPYSITVRNIYVPSDERMPQSLKAWQDPQGIAAEEFKRWVDDGRISRVRR